MSCSGSATASGSAGCPPTAPGGSTSAARPSRACSLARRTGTRARRRGWPPLRVQPERRARADAPPAPEAFPIDGGVHVIFGAAECAAHHEFQWRPHAQAGQPGMQGGRARAARGSRGRRCERNLAGGVRWQFRARSPMRGCRRGSPRRPCWPATRSPTLRRCSASASASATARHNRRPPAAVAAARRRGGALRELGLSRDEALGALRATAGGDSGVPESAPPPPPTTSSARRPPPTTFRRRASRRRSARAERRRVEAVGSVR